jgi:membrane protein
MNDERHGPAGSAHLLSSCIGALAAVFAFVRLAQPRRRTQSEPRLGVTGAVHEVRGREATKPSEIPVRSWRDILLRVYAGLYDNRIFALAAASTYYCLLAMFPATAALVAIYGLFSDPNEIGNQLSSLQGLLPGGAIEVIGDELKRVAFQGNGTLSFAMVAGFIVALWSANSGVKSLFYSLNQVYAEKEKRSFIELNLVTLTFTISAIALLIPAVVAIVALPVALDQLGLSSAITITAKVIRWPMLLIVIAVALAFVYRFGPSRREPKWRWVTWGSAIAALFWVIASFLFSWYAANFGSFNKTYGSLGAIIGFMVWIWISMIVVLLGAELDAEMEHQTARDTTTGSAKPMEQREAYMADTVGPAQN